MMKKMLARLFKKNKINQHKYNYVVNGVDWSLVSHGTKVKHVYANQTVYYFRGFRHHAGEVRAYLSCTPNDEPLGTMNIELLEIIEEESTII